MKNKLSFVKALSLMLSIVLVGCNGLTPGSKEEPIDEKAPQYTGMAISETKTNVAKKKNALTTIDNSYVLHKDEEFLFEIYFDNPYRYEIQSFTINDVKYANYMFEAGSTLDTLYLKSIAPDRYGNYSYTIDAIKYIDDETIKNVRIKGNQTIDVQVVAYQVALDSNGGDITNAIINVDYNANLELPTPNKRGYEFIGWFDENGNKVVDGPYQYRSNITLTASWRVINYQIAYTLNGGYQTANNPLSYTVEDQEIVLANPERKGYTFLGWFDEKGNQVQKISAGSAGDMNLSARWNNGNTYTVNLVPNGGQLATQSLEFIYNQEYDLPTVKRDGYEFVGWFDGNNIVANRGPWLYDTNKTFEAHWSIIDYTIFYDLNGGENAKDNPHTFNVETAVNFLEPYKKGHTFLGWFDENNNKVESIPLNSRFSNLSLTAKWEVNEYTVNLNPNYDNQEPNTQKCLYGENYALEGLSREGYNFLGWFNDNNQLFNEGTYEFDYDLSLHAEWQLIDYQIEYVLNNGTQNEGNPSTYNVESEAITLLNPEREGYNFTGWVDEQNNPVTQIASHSTGDKKLIATWSPKQYELNITSNNLESGKVTINGEGYMDEKVTLIATPEENCFFRGWYDEGGYLLSNDLEYAFVMSSHNCTIEARFYNELEMSEWNNDHGVTPAFSNDGKYISYGMYPQSVVTDEELITKLENVIKNDNDKYYFYNGNYYFKMKANPREEGYQFNNNQVIVRDQEYWFNVAPIDWKILKYDDGNIMLLAKDILDYQKFDDNCRYAPSYLRSWLNEEFYQTAFMLNNDFVGTTLVSNIGETPWKEHNPYASEDTDDKVFVLSRKEALDADLGFYGNSDRWAYASDYVRALGIEYTLSGEYVNHSDYWSRTPYGLYGYDVMFVGRDGEIGGTYACCDWQLGVRPAITLALGAETVNQYRYTYSENGYTYLINNFKENQTAYLVDIDDSITEFELPESVNGFKVVGMANNVFSGEEKHFTRVIIPDFVETIPNDMFRNNQDLEYIKIPGSVKTIGDRAFLDCVSLEEVELSRGLIEIKDEVFEGCSALYELIIPDTVTTIGPNLCWRDSSLEKLYVPDSVTSIDYSLAPGCSSLVEARIPSHLKVIGSQWFNGCHKLQTLNIPENLVKIESYGLTDCHKLDNIAFPKTLKTVEEGALRGDENRNMTFNYNSWLKLSGKEYINATISLKDDNDQEVTEVAIAEGTTRIDKGLFKGCANITSVTIPSGVKTIGQEAFYGCKKLSSINLPDTVTTIGNYAFAKCYALQTFVMPNSVTSVGEGAFSECKGLSSITLSTGLKVLPTKLLNDCDGLTFVDIPEGVTRIDSYAFDNCSNLRNFTIPSTIQTIQDRAFTYSWDIKNVYCRCSQEKWNEIMSTYGHDYDNLYLTHTYFYNESPTEAGSYWKYDENGIPFAYLYYGEGDTLKLEAEDADGSGDYTRYHGEDHNHPEVSGGYIVGDFGDGEQLTFTFYVNEGGEAHLFAQCVFSSYAPLSTQVIIRINGVELDLSAIVAEDYQGDWWDFVSYDLGGITLQDGKNTIEFITTGPCVNVDYLLIVQP